MRTLIAILIVLLQMLASLFGKENIVRYDLYIKDTMVNYNGEEKMAIAINGLIPGPILKFTEGDSAVINVHNMMHHESSIHWHGLLLPNEQDGVSYLTTSPILSHSSHQFNFRIRQNGTYWYHSHTMLQEQLGMYGAIIIHKKDEKIENEEVVLLSDWTNENPDNVERMLHNGSDWFAIQKGASQDYYSALKEGYFATKLTNEWKRMKAMDVSDVYYENFLINGMPSLEKKQYKAGDKVKLRIINGSSSTYFWLNFAGSKLSVVANDGKDLEEVEVDRLLVSVSETYDVIVTIPENNKSYQFQAIAEDRTSNTSLWLGDGEKQFAKNYGKLKYFEGMEMMNKMMKFSGELDDMGMEMSLQQMDMNDVMYPELDEIDSSSQEKIEISTLDYSMLKSKEKTNFSNSEFRTLYFELNGNMNRYVWTINNKTVSESDKILIKQGENIRIIIKNNSMMRHPMHLHGHFFRLLNGQGDYSPLKTVLDIMPMEIDTIEFNASENYGDWFFHCHILYHMMSGMGRIFTYENSPANPQIQDPKSALQMIYNDDNRFYLDAELSLESNGSDGELKYANTRWQLQSEWRLGINDKMGYESEVHISRYVDQNQFFSLYSGWDWRYRKENEEDMKNEEKDIFGQKNTRNKRAVACFGLQYTLPMLIVFDTRVDHTGSFRVQLKRDDIPLSSRLRMWTLVNSDMEYSLGWKYIVDKNLLLSTHYDSDMGWGAGISFAY